MKTWTVYDLDIWGNEEDGWDLNSWYVIKNIDFTDDEINDDTTVIRKLIDEDILVNSTTLYAVQDVGENYLRVVIADTDEPVVDLRMEEFQNE